MFSYALFLAICYIIFSLYSVPMDALLYGLVLCALWLSILFAVDFSRYYKKYKKIEEMSVNILFHLEQTEEPEDMIEQLYWEMLEKLHQEQRRTESENSIAKKEMIDYYSLWVHQIKTPIAAMRILLQAEHTIDFERKAELETELFKIEQYVEMVLSYIRMGDMRSDLRLEWYTVDDIVRPAVRKYSKLFILKKIKLNYETIENKVLTDEKWIGFVLEQLLSNALKYTNEGAISIYMEEGKENILVVEDTGIGIWKEDLPRVFEKGFTGYNGRNEKKSTGIGLYLCKNIVDKLNHRIYISSEVSKGTKVYLNLNADKHSPVFSEQNARWWD